MVFAYKYAQAHNAGITGITLLERHSRGVSLTVAGQALQHHAQRLPSGTVQELVHSLDLRQIILQDPWAERSLLIEHLERAPVTG